MRFKDIEHEYPITKQERYTFCMLSLLDQILEALQPKTIDQVNEEIRLQLGKTPVEKPTRKSTK